MRSDGPLEGAPAKPVGVSVRPRGRGLSSRSGPRGRAGHPPLPRRHLPRGRRSKPQQSLKRAFDLEAARDVPSPWLTGVGISSRARPLPTVIPAEVGIQSADLEPDPTSRLRRPRGCADLEAGPGTSAHRGATSRPGSPARPGLAAPSLRLRSGHASRARVPPPRERLARGREAATYPSRLSLGDRVRGYSAAGDLEAASDTACSPRPRCQGEAFTIERFPPQVIPAEAGTRAAPLAASRLGPASKPLTGPLPSGEGTPRATPGGGSDTALRESPPYQRGREGDSWVCVPGCRPRGRFRPRGRVST